MRSIVMIALFFILINKIAAQSKPGKYTFYLIPQIALLNGDHSASGQVQLTGGIEKKGWSIGIGTAIDYYKVRTVPLFVDVRTGFGKNRLLFSYLNLGSNIAWPLESQYSYPVLYRDTRGSSFSNGVYTDLGIGYHLINGKKNRGMVMSLGYSTKTISESYYEAIYRGFPPYIMEYHERKLGYTLNKIVIRCGIRL
ncbi:MAG: hypothetical protein Q8L07_07390 [Sediminibacterium sp.]|nr:hypothetical protein [Sediminibacterium sp.]